MEFDGGLSFDEIFMETGGAGASIPTGVRLGRGWGKRAEVEGRLGKALTEGFEARRP